MVRVSTPLETATTFALAGDGRATGLLRRYLGWRGMGPDRCLAIVGLTGDARRGRGGRPRGRRPRPRLGRHRRTGHRLGLAALAVRRAVPAQRPVGRGLRGRHARDRDRLDAPARPRRRPRPDRCATASRRRASASTRSATCRTATRPVRACTRPTSSAWPPTRTRRSSAGGRSRRPPAGVIVEHGATISHQHGVGIDHAPYLAAREGGARDGGDRGASSGPSTRTGGWPAARCSGRPP